MTLPLFVWVVVQHAADRITRIGPAFSTEAAAQNYADTLPSEWHAGVDRIHLDPDVALYLEKVTARS